MSAELIRCRHCGRRNRVPAVAAGIPRCGNCRQPLPWIAAADDTTFAEVAEAASIPVVIDLWAPWCGPCRMVSPALEELATTLAGRVKLVKVNVDDSPHIQERFGVRAIPTLIVLRQGQAGARRSGAAPPPTCAPGSSRRSALTDRPVTSSDRHLISRRHEGGSPCRPTCGNRQVRLRSGRAPTCRT